MIKWLGNKSLLFLISSVFGLLYVGLMVGFFHNEIGMIIIDSKYSVIVSYEEYQENNRLQEAREIEIQKIHQAEIRINKQKRIEFQILKQVEENIRLETARKLMEENKKKEKSRDIFCLVMPCWFL